MAERKLVYIILYIGMIIFFTFPLFKLWQGVVLEMHVIFLSLGFAVAFGFFATRELMKDEKEKGRGEI